MHKFAVTFNLEKVNIFIHCPYSLPYAFFQINSSQTASVPWLLETVHHNTEIRISL